jgi:hypothetical protein
MSFGIVGKDREGIGSADTDGSWERPAELCVPRMRYCLPFVVVQFIQISWNTRRNWRLIRAVSRRYVRTLSAVKRQHVIRSYR